MSNGNVSKATVHSGGTSKTHRVEAVSPQTDRLYQRSGDLWLHYRRTGNRVNQRLNHGTFSRIAGWCPALPPNVCCADIRWSRVSLTLLLIGHHGPSPQTARYIDLAATVRTLDPHHSWATATLLQSDNGVAVAPAITSGDGRAVSDGSYKNSRSTSAFLLEGPTGAVGRIFGTNCVPGQRMDQDSYHGELGGVMGVLHTARCVTMIHEVASGLLHIGSDGEEAMKQAALIGLVNPKMCSYDLIAEIRALRSCLLIQVEFSGWMDTSRSATAKKTTKVI
jgi:hypothetical protein